MNSDLTEFSDSKNDINDNFAFLVAGIIYKLDHDLSFKTLSKYKMTYVHFRVLQYLWSRNGETIGEIAKSIVVRQPVLSRIIDQMQERGLVTRQADSNDGRYIRVYLTDSGKEKYEEVWPKAKEMIVDALSVLKADEYDELMRMLRMISSNLLDE